jgi:uncharacterized damage-inducible protein DinB
MKSLFTAVSLFALLAGVAAAADAPNPLVGTSHGFYGLIKGDVLASAEKVPEADYSFRPTPDVRTFGEILGHIANAQFMMCGIASDGKPVSKDFEKTAKTKAEIEAALKEGFAFCDAVYAKMTDADAATMVPFFGHQVTKLGMLDFNIAHSFEHYGNLVTYMRIKGIVPPSSTPRKPAAGAAPMH